MLLQSLGEPVTGVYANYWMYTSAETYIVVSFASCLTIYKIIYMFLFLLCLTLFHIYNSLWQKLFEMFWWLAMVYTVLGLIAAYNFQLPDIPWHSCA